MADRLTVINGDALGELRRLASESVHCVVTSPPYWGLRDYGLEPQVWSGAVDCEHGWNSAGFRHKGGPQGQGGQRANRDVSAQNEAQHIGVGDFCDCGAWRGCLGLEPTPEMYVEHMVEIFREVRRVLRSDGTCWLNLGDSYATQPGKGNNVPQTKWKANSYPEQAAHRSKELPGLKPKDLVGIPWMVAFALRADGWYLRSEIIWNKPNPMPESVTDRPTKAHEQIFLLSKSPMYYYDAEAIREPFADERQGNPGLYKKTSSGERKACNDRQDLGFINAGGGWNHNGEKQGRNRRSVWTIAPRPYPGSHFATFPPDLIKPCILAGTSARGCCVECGAPYERIKEPTAEYAKLLGKDWSDPEQDESEGRGHFIMPTGQKSAQRPVKRNGQSVTAEYVTVGWEATCSCFYGPAFGDTKPCVVLDCFGGSGTTGKVALELGRNSILIELNPEYVRLIEDRCTVTYGLAF